MDSPYDCMVSIPPPLLNWLLKNVLDRDHVSIGFWFL